MSTTDHGGGQAGGLSSAGLPESLRFVALGLLPSLVRGLFAPRPWAMKALGKVDADGRTVTTLRAIRAKHPGEGAKLLGGRLVLLWGPEAIRQVLDRSAYEYASDSGAKGKGMSHFQPDALTLSRGEEWEDRRAFAESVLATPERVHPQGAHFLAVVADEVARLRVGDELTWDEWEQLFDHVTLRVIFGDGARNDAELTATLGDLMAEANRLVGLSESGDLYDLHGRIEHYLRDPDPDSLVGRVADAPQSDVTRIVHQIPHWMFAMRDTLGANTFRALAVIAADPELCRRVRAELESADLGSAGELDGLGYLEGVLQEVMRLWPTVPLLARETTERTTLAGEELEAGTQVMIVNTFNHRDPDQVSDADRVAPERWAGGERDYRFNHLSNGSQDCPGAAMVLLLGKAVLTRVLEEYTLTLHEPELPAGGPLPNMLDYYSIRLGADARA